MLWDPKLETGVQLIDDQHRELFRRIDVLLDVSAQKSSKEKIQETMGFLGDYILKHFRDEEKLHAESIYPKALIHKHYHDSYSLEFKKLQLQYKMEGDSLNMVLSVNRNVVNWLVNHINVHDKEFSNYYRMLSKSTA